MCLICNIERYVNKEINGRGLLQQVVPLKARHYFIGIRKVTALRKFLLVIRTSFSKPNSVLSPTAVHVGSCAQLRYAQCLCDKINGF